MKVRLCEEFNGPHLSSWWASLQHAAAEITVELWGSVGLVLMESRPHEGSGRVQNQVHHHLTGRHLRPGIQFCLIRSWRELKRDSEDWNLLTLWSVLHEEVRDSERTSRTPERSWNTGPKSFLFFDSEFVDFQNRYLSTGSRISRVCLNSAPSGSTSAPGSESLVSSS